jgi:hypothetical protein
MRVDELIPFECGFSNSPAQADGWIVSVSQISVSEEMCPIFQQTETPLYIS